MYDKFNRGKEDKLKPSINDPPDLCLRNLERVLMRCEETNLVISWEKCHFMVQEGIVLGHKISRDGIEVDRAKISTIEKLPPPTLRRITLQQRKSFLLLILPLINFGHTCCCQRWPSIQIIQHYVTFGAR